MSSNNSDAILEVVDLLVYYENAIAINNVSLNCRKGQITGIFGANSAGKSTLMHTVSGLILDMRDKEQKKGGERITWYGDVKYNGEDIINLKPSDRARKGLILSPERRQVFPESSTLENIKMIYLK